MGVERQFLATGSRGGKLPHCFPNGTGPACERSRKLAACNCRGLKWESAVSCPLQAPSRTCWAHFALPVTLEIPNFLGQGASFPQTGTADASLPLLGGWQVPSAWDGPPKCLGVQGVTSQRQPASATGREGTAGAEAHSTQIWAGDLLPSLLFLDFLWKWHTAGPPTPDFTSCMKLF